MAKRSVDNARTITVSTPEELDKLLEWVNAGSTRGAMQHEGEHLFATERLVVSPAAGVFSPIGTVSDGALIEVGEVLGHVGDAEVRSPFAGVVQSYIAVDGERVTLRQPIAWLRTV
jgi:[acyl-carrier-protein] S-malonyltransferase